MAPRKAPKNRDVVSDETSVSKRARIPRNQKNKETTVTEDKVTGNGNVNEEKEEVVLNKAPTKKGRKAKSASEEKSVPPLEDKEDTVEDAKVQNGGQQKKTRKVKAKEVVSESDDVENDNEAISVPETEAKKTKRGKRVVEKESVDDSEAPSKKRKIEAEEEDESEENVKEISKKSAVPDQKVGRKRNINLKTIEEDSDFEDDNPKVSKSAKATKAEVPKNEAMASKKIDFSNDSVSSEGKKWNLKITSWNVNGIRAWLQKDGLDYINEENSDIMCIQETKCADNKLPTEIKNLNGYHCYWLSGDKDGYSGVGLLSKEKPIDVKYGIDIEKHDGEGRVITAEYAEFFLVTSYTPNAGKDLVRLDYRQEFDVDFRNYIKMLDEKKPVILCGDLNVAHEEIDLANPKTNKKNAGFTKEERDGFSSLLNEGFVDSFRHLYPEEQNAYTFWTYMRNARAKNVGWRLDYFVLSKRLLSHLCDNVIRKDVLGSDHCPLTLFLAI